MPGHPAAAAPEQVASLSAGLFSRATLPVPAPLVLLDTQLWLPSRHQLESRSDLVQTCSLATAGGA